MSFLQPWMLFGLLGAAIPIVIHLIYKRKPKKLPFGPIELVQKSIERIENRWRLKRFLLLASRVLLLAALAIAASRPLLGEEAADPTKTSGPERVAIVIDGSLSMRQSHDGRDAFSRALTLARNLVDDLGPEDQAVIVLASNPSELHPESPTASVRGLLEHLEDLEPGYAHVDLAEAITLAGRTLGDPEGGERGGSDPSARGGAEEAAPKKRIVVLTDLSGHAFRAAADLSGVQPTPSVEIVDVLEDVDTELRSNRAITHLTLDNIPGEQPRTMEARARIRSFSTEDDEAEAVALSITLRAEDRELAAGSVDVIEGTVVDKSLVHAFESPGSVRLSMVLESDVLTEDDVRHDVADVRPEVRTLIVDGAPSGVPKEDEVFYLERALLAGARDQPAPRVVTPDDLRRTDLASFDVVMLVGVPVIGREDGARLVEFVESGGGLLISASEDLDTASYNSALDPVLPRRFRGLKRVGAAAAGSAGPSTIAVPEDEHPVTIVFEGEAMEGLTSAETNGYLLLEPEGSREARVLLTFEDGQPALIERDHGQGRVLVLTTSLDRDLSDLAIRPAFLPLIRRALLYLGNALAPSRTRWVLVGESYSLEAPRGATTLEITDPSGHRSRLRVPPNRSAKTAPEVVFEDTGLPGHYDVRIGVAGKFDPAPDWAFAVNPDPRESDLRPVTVFEATAVIMGSSPEVGAEEMTTLARLGQKGWADPESLAALLLGLALLAFLLESALTAQRPPPRREIRT